jgi:predicted nucleic acid-binding protein
LVSNAPTRLRAAPVETFVQNILSQVPIHPFDLAQARLYAVHFADLTKRGERIGDRDLQIAFTALSLNYELATLNVREFERVKALKLVDVSPYTIS